MKVFKKSFLYIILLSIVITIVSPTTSVMASITLQQAINSLQAIDPFLPTDVSNPKGSIGYILSEIFYGSADGLKNGKIKPQYLDLSAIVSSQWTSSGTSIFYTGGNVGIGVSSPEFKLEINGDASFNDVQIGRGSGSVASNTVVGINSLYSNTSGGWNTSVGFQSMYSNTTGGANTALGYQTLGANTSGNTNAAIGYMSMFSNTSGISNSSIGYQSLFSNTTGGGNSGIGYQALANNTSGNSNMAVGYQSLFFNSTGSQNVAIGQQSMYSNTTGSNNASLGGGSMFRNTTGVNNAAVGYTALFSNTTGIQNTAIGSSALYSNTIGSANTAIGLGALVPNISGNRNTAIGNLSMGGGVGGDANVAIGDSALATNSGGTYNVAIGQGAMNSYSGSFPIPASYFSKSNFNIAIGSSALSHISTGSGNVVVGSNAMPGSTGSRVTGIGNAGLGTSVLIGNTTGNYNTALGYLANVGYTNLTNATAIGANSRVDCANCLVLGSSVNVGIGTTSPAAKLDIQNGWTFVNNSSSTTNRNYGIALWSDKRFGMELGYDGTHSTRLFTRDTDGVITFGKSSGSGTQNHFTEQMRIANNGNVGIGTNNPLNLLDVNGISRFRSQVTVFAGSNSADASLIVNNAANTLNYLYVRGDGNIGIGTTNPNAKLSISNGAISSGPNGSYTNFQTILYDGGTANSSYGFGIDTNTLWYNSNAYHDFYVAGSPVMRIGYAGGYVGIGTTNPTSKLQVVGLPVYINNAAAIAGGLTAGAFYRNGADPDIVCVVH